MHSSRTSRHAAQRSATAAKEIKALIQPSAEKVEGGSRRVLNAGSAMIDIVAGFKRVTDITGEISAAAVDQTSGIDNVNASAADLDRMTQQNAALAEQSGAAAHNLRDQAARLSGSVAVFRLQDEKVES